MKGRLKKIDNDWFIQYVESKWNVESKWTMGVGETRMVKTIPLHPTDLDWESFLGWTNKEVEFEIIKKLKTEFIPIGLGHWKNEEISYAKILDIPVNTNNCVSWDKVLLQYTGSSDIYEFINYLKSNYCSPTKQ